MRPASRNSSMIDSISLSWALLDAKWTIIDDLLADWDRPNAHNQSRYRSASLRSRSNPFPDLLFLGHDINGIIMFVLISSVAQYSILRMFGADACVCVHSSLAASSYTYTYRLLWRSDLGILLKISWRSHVPAYRTPSIMMLSASSTSKGLLPNICPSLCM